MIELKDTTRYMNSDSYEKRFIAEYTQTKIRHQKLRQTIIKYEAGSLPFILTNIALLKEQCIAMERYLSVLEARANLEGINVDILWRKYNERDTV